LDAYRFFYILIRGVSMNDHNAGGYTRYHIEAKPAPDIQKWPARFDVRVSRVGLATHLIKEVLHRGPLNHQVILSRPCIYGVFSGPVGGFMPRPRECVACLRCTTEFPSMLKVAPNPKRLQLGDGYFTSNYVDTLSYEVAEGSIPVKGAGYRGKFGGEGWDNMWTDMSEIVRPTRDGIHGREFISTVTDIGFKPNFLNFDEAGQPGGIRPEVISLPLPMLFDAASPAMADARLWKIIAEAAHGIGTLAFLPLNGILAHGLQGDHIVPVVKAGEQEKLAATRPPRLIELDGWDETLFDFIRTKFPNALVSLRIPYSPSEALLQHVKKGIYVFHCLADFHGRDGDGRFALELIRATHTALVQAGIREQVTLLGSGGIIAAEHIPKALLCGLDAIAIDTPLVVALQGKFDGECADRISSHFLLPKMIPESWGVQRMLNLAVSWRDQLLEISGAMGLRETRRMRGEMGRAMLLHTLEAEAFSGLEGYERA
jgi:hypothetical protein